MVSQDGVSPELARTNIDIGGPCMIRASAKNYIRVVSVTDVEDYPALIAEARDNKGAISLDTRFKLMQKAFAHTAEYDSAIAAHFRAVTPASMADTYDCPPII